MEAMNQQSMGNGYVQPNMGGYGYAQPQMNYGQPYGGYGQPNYGYAQPNYGYAQPNFGGYNPYTQNVYNMKVDGVLTDDERNSLRANRGKGFIDLSIDPLELTASICDHINHGVDMVRQLDDGKVICLDCHEVWDPTEIPAEELEEAVNKVISALQNIKWMGGLPDEVIRKFMTIIPMIKKINGLYDYTMKRVHNSYSYNSFYGNDDVSIYNKFNNVMGMPGMMGGYPAYGYQPQMGYGQPNVGYGQPMGYQPQGQPTVTDPSVNPMYAPQQPQGYQPQMGQPMGYQPNVGYGQPQMGYGQPQMGYQPQQPQVGYGQPQNPQQPQMQPNFQPQPQGYQPQATQQANNGTTQTTEATQTAEVSAKV